MKIGVWLRYTVCLSGSEGWQGNCKKLLEGSNICECYYSMKFKKKKSCFQTEISVSSVPIIFFYACLRLHNENQDMIPV